MGDAKPRAEELAEIKAKGLAQAQQQQIDHQAMQQMQMIASKEAVFINGFSIGDSGRMVRCTMLESVGFVSQPRFGMVMELKEALQLSDGLLQVVTMMAKANGLTVEGLREAGKPALVATGAMAD
jgi:hypothetical protein